MTMWRVNFSAIVEALERDDSANGKDLQPKAHSSGPNTSQYTFASVGVQAAASSIDTRRAGDGMYHHGWQPALMTSCMWLANVTGEFLYRMGEDVTVVPKRAPSRLIDDPLGALEQAVGDLKLAFTAKDLSAMLRQVAVMIYYAVQMTTSLQLHPYLSSAFLWVHG